MSRYFSLATVIAMLLMAGCTYFRLPVLQGNIVDYDKAEKLELGMTPRQVEFLLGTPLIRDSFGSPRWDYVVYYRNPDAEVLQKNLSIYFENDVVARIEGRDALLADWRRQKAILKKAKEPLEVPHPGQFPANASKTSGPGDTTEPHPVLPPSQRENPAIENEDRPPAASGKKASGAAPAPTARPAAESSQSWPQAYESGWVESPDSDNSNTARTNSSAGSPQEAPADAGKPTASTTPDAYNSRPPEDTSGESESPGSDSKQATGTGSHETSTEQADDYPPDMTTIYKQ